MSQCHDTYELDEPPVSAPVDAIGAQCHDLYPDQDVPSQTELVATQ
jgi:hypothetical protein